jgi:alpha-galactosidase
MIAPARRRAALPQALPVAAVAASMLLSLAAALDNGVGRRPTLGWNSWNIFACSVNETLMRDTMDAFVTLGLRDAGYVYVGVDDCWAKSRDPTTSVIQSDPQTFPSGMAALADYAHARGLKFGLYSSNSPNTCDGRPVRLRDARRADVRLVGSRPAQIRQLRRPAHDRPARGALPRHARCAERNGAADDLRRLRVGR